MPSPAVICSPASCGSENPILSRGPTGPTLGLLRKCSRRRSKGDAHPSAPQPCPRGQASPHLEETVGRRGEAAPPLPEGREEGTRWKSQAATVRGHTRVGSWVLPPPCRQGPWPGSSSGILARVPTCPRHLSSGVSVGSCSTQGPQVLCKAAPRGLISMWPSGEAALLCDKFITCGIVLVGYEKSAVAW